MIARLFPLGIFAVLALCAGCGGEDNPVGANGGTVLIDCPDTANGALTEQNIVFQGDRYVYVPIPQGTDPRAHSLFAEIWDVVRVQPAVECW